jgi:phage tail sheath protein FI
LYLQHELIAHCTRLKDRVAVLDPRIEDVSQQAVIGWRNEFDSMYAALYYPWLMVPDPLRLEGLLRAVPPSGHIAGIYARGDLNVGVHKPPANEQLEGVLDLATSYFARLRATPEQRQASPEALGAIDDIAHGVLNEQQINVIRAYPGRGVRVMGARTLSSESVWRYVNVRRLMIMIEEAIEERAQWIVFEPNNRDLWREIARVVRSFLDELWQRGMLDGSTAEEAYAIACDSDTNQPDEVELGRAICEIKLLLPWPAEFVIVRMGRIDDRIGIIR